MLQRHRIYLNGIALASSTLFVIALLFVLQRGGGESLPKAATGNGQPTAAQPVLSPAAAPTQTVAVVSGTLISRAEWQATAALDRVMNQLAGQPAPNAEATLERLINERLILQLAQREHPMPTDPQAQERLALLQQTWRVENATIERTLTFAGLTRADLLAEIKRLILVETYLKQISAAQDPATWLRDQRARARVSIYADLPAADGAPPTSPASLAPTERAVSTRVAPVATAAAAATVQTGPAIGQLAPDFALTDASGQPVKLSATRGRPLVLNFWATWCSPCRQELPALQTVYERYVDRDVILWGIDVRENVQAVNQATNKFGLTYPMPLDLDGAVASLYQVRGTPTTIFIDAEGVIRARHVGPLTEDKYAQYVEPLLASPTPNPRLFDPAVLSQEAIR